MLYVLVCKNNDLFLIYQIIRNIIGDFFYFTVFLNPIFLK